MSARTAAVAQTHWRRCGHTLLSESPEELRARGVTKVRVTAYLDVGGLCPDCTERAGRGEPVAAAMKGWD